ncbi:MAG: glycosyltransferase [Verrucomicrobia bacterium]|nr:glycosyltransferase [Verrucomicrobiota bacterium]
MLLYVGRFSPDKDTALLLRMWKRVEELEGGDWVGVMVGDGQMKPEAEDFVRRHTRIRIVPFLKESAELAEWYQASDLLIHPGRWETFGVNDRSSNSLALGVVKRMHSLPDPDRHSLSGFIQGKFSWEKTFTQQLTEYEDRG